MRLINYFFILLFAASSAFCDELPMESPIVIPNQLKIVWEANDLSDNVIKYNIYVKSEDSSLSFSSVDNFFSLNLSPYSLKPQRIYIYVTALNSSAESLPSDTVNYIYSSTKCLFGDYDGNGEVSGLDLMMFWNSFWCTKGANKDYNSIFDYDQDGFIGGIDHQAMIVNFHEILPQE